jgi:MFS transporter, ACS family, D-galactonate transporter
MADRLNIRETVEGLRSRVTGRYTTLWALLLLGWVVSYADRTLTGPVVSWMITNKAGFIGEASNPATLGGLVGSMFFAGYMLTQYPGGRLGDRYGHREMIVLSLVWAAVLTLISGLMTGLVFFVAARVLTGLGEGVFYSNDRTLIINNSPVAKRTLGLGVVISGLAIGLTLGILLPPILIAWAQSSLGKDAWRMPFFVFAAASVIVAVAAFAYFRSRMGVLRLGRPLLQLIIFSVPTFVAIVAIFLLANALHWKEWTTAVAVGVLALIYIVVIARGVAREGNARTLFSRDNLLLYIGFIAVLWNLWFFSFWSVQIVKEAAHSSLIAAGLTAAFNAGAGIIGFPLGGWIADWNIRRGGGRKSLLLACTAIYSILAFLFGLQVMGGGKPSLLVLGLLLFTSGLFFNALQPIEHGIAGDQVPPNLRGSAFGMMNLISEIGAVASPVVSGILRDKTGSWAPGVFVAVALMVIAGLMWVFVREKFPGHHEDPAPA